MSAVQIRLTQTPHLLKLKPVSPGFNPNSTPTPLTRTPANSNYFSASPGSSSYSGVLLYIHCRIKL